MGMPCLPLTVWLIILVGAIFICPVPKDKRAKE